MKQTVILTVEATDIINAPEITQNQIDAFKEDLARHFAEMGIGLDDLHIKWQVFQHEDE